MMNLLDIHKPHTRDSVVQVQDHQELLRRVQLPARAQAQLVLSWGMVVDASVLTPCTGGPAPCADGGPLLAPVVRLLAPVPVVLLLVPVVLLLAQVVWLLASGVQQFATTA